MIGSESPWVEACVLAAGATSVVTWALEPVHIWIFSSACIAAPLLGRDLSVRCVGVAVSRESVVSSRSLGFQTP